jgi:hypothetical protein
VARPAASRLTSAAIRGSDSAAAEFTPDAAGTYIVRLTATDGLEGDADNVLILVKENQPPRAEPDSAATSVYSRGHRGAGRRQRSRRRPAVDPRDQPGEPG